MNAPSSPQALPDRVRSPLSVVICAFNGLGYTKLLLESIRRFSLFDHEVVVWSDGSTDGTAEWLAEQAGLVWQHDPENRGICTAMNRAAALASRPYLFFPNTDHVLAPGWDEALLRRLGPRTVVSLSCIEPGIVPVASIFHTADFGTRWEEFDWVEFETTSRRLLRPEATPGVNYPFALARLLWDEVGALDERFNPGPANDPDLFYRLKLAGAEMIRAEDCLAYHFSGKSSRMADEAVRERREWRDLTDRNEMRFEEKWGERYRYANGGLPDPGSEAKRRWFMGDLRPAPASQRLRVVVDARLIREEPDGIGAYIAGLVRSLARLDRDVELTVLSNAPHLLARRVGPIRGFKCRIVQAKPGDSANEAKEFAQVVSETKADVFHGPSFSIAQGLHCACVVTIHDVAFDLHPEWYPPDFVAHLRHEVRRSVAQASRVIAVSSCTAQDLARQFGVKPEDINVIAEAADERVKSRHEGDLGELPRGAFHEGSAYLIAVGMKQKRKNALALLRAYMGLVRSGRSAGVGLLMTLAAANEDPEFVAHARSLGHDADVCLASRLSDEELDRAIAGAAALVYPSAYEGFGLPVLDAMVRGCPVVCGNQGALPEVAGDAAITVDGKDAGILESALARLLAEPDLRRNLARRGLARALHFSWDEVARKTLDVYRKAVDRHGSRGGRCQVAPAISDDTSSTRVPIVSATDRRPLRIPDRLRVAVDARMTIAPHTGTGRYTLEILRQLGQASAGKAEFVLIGPKTATELGLGDALPVVQHVEAGPETLLDPAWEQFSSNSALAGCDVVFAPTGILPLTRSCPGIAVIHDLGFLDHPGDFEPRLRDYLTRWMRRTCLSAERLIAISEFTKGRVVENFGVAPAKIRVVHHGRPGAQTAGSGAVSPPIVLCVSALEPNKNQLVLLDAFAKSGLAKEARLVLAGREGRALPLVLARIRELKLEESVRIEASADDALIRDLYRIASVFAFPSRYEGFGLPVVEAMSAGVPVLASRIPACVEVAGDAAVFADPGDAEAWARELTELVRSPMRRRELAKRSLARAQDFDWGRSAQSTWETVLEALSR